MNEQGNESDEVLNRARAGRIAVLYDGACEFCRGGAEAVRIYDNSGIIDLIDLHEESVLEQFPGLKLDDLMRELHVVDDRGRVWRGARAINEVLRRQTGIVGYIAYLWYFPGFAWLANWQYRRIAASRYAIALNRTANKVSATNKVSAG